MNNVVDKPVDPYLHLPLDGIHLIEASAGTGKTFTLATLFTRLVVEKQLRIGQILAVTFTEAATQELRKRIRQRLQLAARLLQGDENIASNPEQELTLQILHNHVDNSGESAAALQRRLQQAADEVDLAAIFTIHGFCARVLREHALESGQTFAAPELLGSERELLEIIATELWRLHAADADTLAVLRTLWAAPDALAGDLKVLLAGYPLAPAATPAPVITYSPLPALEAARARLSALADDDAFDALAGALAKAFADKVFDGRRARQPSFLKAQDTLRKGARSGRLSWDKDDHLIKLLPEQLLGYAKDGQHDKVPRSPVLDALAQVYGAQQQYVLWLRQQARGLLEQITAEAGLRLEQLKRQRRVQGYDDLINGVAEVFEPLPGDTPAEVADTHRERADALAQRLRAQYAIALVDEFQDTDNRQWQIFRYVFGNPNGQGAAAPALFLIGDPKQAIYGFRGGDVNTYLAAADQADDAPALNRNFRSRPGVLTAIEQLYANANAATGGHAFVVDGIAFHPVLPGTKRVDSDYLINNAPAPALEVRIVPVADEKKAFSAEQSRQLATQACVAHIHAVLSAGQAGTALIDGKPVQPGDIAVLVRKHSEATRIQQALAAVGIPAVAAGKQSLFASQEAKDIQVLLMALLQPGDEGRLRALLATVLIGLPASAIAALEHDGERQRQYQLQVLQWRERWLKAGTLALVSDLCADNGARLLALFDGERRLTNYLQLAELLQQADARALGLHGLVDWLGQHIAGADPDDEAQLLRLESDARRVQIVTLHKSKGLEYPLVYLPFVGIGSKPSAPERHCVVYDATDSGDGSSKQRRLHWKLDKEDPAWLGAVNRHGIEEAAEDARLLYVGLTRAEHALWLVSGPFYGGATTHLGRMLSNVEALSATGVVSIDDSPLCEQRLPLLRLASGAAVPPARQVTRTVAHDWWVYSFTQLAHAEAGNDSAAASTVAAAGAGDEPADTPEPDAQAPAGASALWDPRFSGSRFGNVLHDALEHTDFAAWQGWQAGQPAPASAHAGIAEALRAEGYVEGELKDGIALVTGLVGQTLTVPLPEGGCLADVGPGERRAEIEFHFAMAPTAVPALIQLLHRFDISTGRNGFGLRRQLEGLMTGKIDLTYTRDGRWYVLDYKSNRLPDYRKNRLEQAMRHSEYDLQALIYTLALHRWLRFRTAGQYDYSRDFGGIRYLFCRGLDATDATTPGVYAHCYPQELVDGLDRLFAGGQHGHEALLQRLGGRP